MYRVISFEDQNDLEYFASTNSEIYLSDRHKKDGAYSLAWDFDRLAELCLDLPIPYEAKNPDATDKAESTFALSLYSAEPLQGSLEFRFFKEKDPLCSFRLNLGFEGWRTVWVPFDRAMTGRPEEGMDRLVIVADCQAGKLYLDQMILASPVDPRHPSRDFLVPFVNIRADYAANAHWMSLYRFSQLEKAFEDNRVHGLKESVADHVRTDLKTVEDRYEAYCLHDLERLGRQNLARCRAFYRELHISTMKEGDRVKILGRTVDLPVSRAIWPENLAEDLLEKTDPIGIRDVGTFLLQLASLHRLSERAEETTEIERMFAETIGLLFYHGFQDGSGLGTVHHMGYQMREFYEACFLMRKTLAEKDLLYPLNRAIRWFSGLGRIYRDAEEIKGESMDTLNTLSQGMLAGVLTMPDEKERVMALEAYGNWLDICLAPGSGLRGPFKPDGSSFHHCNHYPAYALGGFRGISPVLYFLSGGHFSVKEQAHAGIRKSLLMMRLYCNTYNWLLSMASRHPIGEGKHASISTLDPFWYLALAGSPDGGAKVDEELAGAYLRLAKEAEGIPLIGKESDRVSYLEGLGYQEEKAPEGHWTMNYAAAALHRRGEWLCGVRGHSRYLWANETYLNANLYGRYISHGHLQVLSRGKPITHRANGYQIEGYDFSSWPGTTAIHLETDALKSHVRNVDNLSGFEEMLLSDQSFAGGTGSDRTGNGVFAMILHEHPKYNGSHWARKSWFFMDDLILCLGSDIENTNGDHETFTTLFQCALERDLKGKATYLEDRVLEESPEELRLTLEKATYLLDPTSNAYFIPGGQDLVFSQKLQHAKSPITSEPTEGHFAKARLSHGKAPKSGSYTYVLRPQTSREEAAALSEILQVDAPFTIYRQDKTAHVVYDRKQETMQYVLFEAGEVHIDGADRVLCHTDTPCLVMEHREKGPDGQNFLHLDISDPDLRLYEGKDQSQYDRDGKRQEVSVYSRPWLNNESIAHKMTLTLDGLWGLEKDPAAGVRHEGGKSYLDLTTLDAGVYHLILKALD